MAAVLTENLEALAGYDAGGWTEGVSGGSTVDEDSPAGPGFPNGWGAQCLRIDRLPSTNSYTFNIPGATAITFTRVELMLSALTLASEADTNLVFICTDATLATVLWAVQVQKVGGVDHILVAVATDTGVSTVPWREPLAFNKLYRFEVKYDTTNDLWSVKVNGILFGSGALAGVPATVPVGAVLIGDTASALGTYTARYDKILVDNSTSIDPDAPGPSSIRSRGIVPREADFEDEGRFNELNVRNWW